jgi:hypothetical protein
MSGGGGAGRPPPLLGARLALLQEPKDPTYGPVYVPSSEVRVLRADPNIDVLGGPSANFRAKSPKYFRG